MSEEVDTLFQEAVDALRGGDRPRAKELLTRLIKAEQNNVNYWVWMSAAVETNKERVYCLQTALRIDPENAAAKRGLILLGALPPDESVQPFPVNRPRVWEENLKLAHERPKEKKPFLKTPAARLAGLGALAFVICGLVIFGFTLSGNRQFSLGPTHTPGPSPTFTLTPTLIGATAPVTPTFIGPTPLWAFLPATYTPTPFYMPAVSDPQLTEILRAVRIAYGKGNWEEMIGYLQQGLTIRPDLPDLWYLIGEGYRFQEKYTEALDAYARALEINPDFAPPHVGRARVLLAQDKEADPLPELDLAIEKDPNFAEAYLLRAAYKTDHNDPEGALEDLTIAEGLSPNSALVYYEYARAYLALGETKKAVEAAERAKQIDITIVPIYLVLGEAYTANSQPKEALQALQTYTTYATEDPAVFFILGKLNYLSGDYEAALDYLDRYIKIDNKPEARLYRGLTLVELGRGSEAIFELDHALDTYPESFEGNIGLARALYLDGQFGTAALQADTAFLYAGTDEQKAQVYYWRAKSLEKTTNRVSSAKRDWESLLALPASAMPAAWRTEAQKRIAALTTPSVTPTPTTTGTPTKTPSPTRTPSPGPSPTPTPR